MVASTRRCSHRSSKPLISDETSTKQNGCTKGSTLAIQASAEAECYVGVGHYYHGCLRVIWMCSSSGRFGQIESRVDQLGLGHEDVVTTKLIFWIQKPLLYSRICENEE